MRPQTLRAVLALSRRHAAAQRVRAALACHECPMTLATPTTTTTMAMTTTRQAVEEDDADKCSSNSSNISSSTTRDVCACFSHITPRAALTATTTANDSSSSSSSSNSDSDSSRHRHDMNAALVTARQRYAQKSAAPLCGVVVAVSQAMQQLPLLLPAASSSSSSSSSSSVCCELPLLSWLRAGGAHVVGTLCTHTPLALHDGCSYVRVAGATDATANDTTHCTTTATATAMTTTTTTTATVDCAATAVWRGACHVALTCSLYGPAALTAAAAHDVAAYKPTAQTLGTHTAHYTPCASSVSFGLVARDVHDVRALWQRYTSATSNDDDDDDDACASTTDITHASSNSSNKMKGAAAAARASSSRAHVYTRSDVPNHGVDGYTVRDRPGRLAAIDIGWRDYNAALYCVDDDDDAVVAVMDDDDDDGRRARATTTMMMMRQQRYGGGAAYSLSRLRRWLRRRRRLRQLRRQQYASRRIEVTVGCLPEWHDAYCSDGYGTAQRFDRQLRRTRQRSQGQHVTHRRSTTTTNNNNADDDDGGCDEVVLRTVALPCNVDVVEAAVHAYTTIAHYELSAVAAAVASSDKADVDQRTQPQHEQQQDNAALLTAAAAAAPRVSVVDYNDALRVRDETARCLHECFVDADVLALPLLTAPYASGCVHSVSTALPCALAGLPMVSLRMCSSAAAAMPIVLVGELGSDTTLLQHACRIADVLRA